MGIGHPHMEPTSSLPGCRAAAEGAGAAPGSTHPLTATEKLNADNSVQTHLAPLNSWHERNFPNWFLSYFFFFFNKLLLVSCIPQTPL